jgi:hypothetical protein
MLKQKSIMKMLFLLLIAFSVSVFAQEKSSCSDSSKCKSTCDSKMTDKKETSKDQAVVKAWNKVCPVMGEEVDADAPTVVYKDKVIGFCCAGCEKKFAKDPERYMKKLNEDGSKLLTSN